MAGILDINKFDDDPEAPQDDAFEGLRNNSRGQNQAPATPTPAQMRHVAHMLDTRVRRSAPSQQRAVKDTFSFQPKELEILDQQVIRAMKHLRRLGKSGIIRAGLLLLASLDEQGFADAIAVVQEIKKGPAKRY